MGVVGVIGGGQPLNTLAPKVVWARVSQVKPRRGTPNMSWMLASRLKWS